MKKTIIILSILSLIVISLNIYIGYKYVDSLNQINNLSYQKDELINTNIDLETKNQDLNNTYNLKTRNLLNENIGCYLWKTLEENLKKIKK